MNRVDDPILTRAAVAFDSTAIDAAVTRVADAITSECAGHDPVVLCVLAGAMPFTAALIPRMQFALELDFARLSRYRDGTRGGELRWMQEPATSLADREVIIVDDVLDAGDTLAELRRYCTDAGAASVRDAVLVVKASTRRPEGLVPTWSGLQAGPGFLFGYGMDLDGHYRNLPEIRILPGEEGA